MNLYTYKIVYMSRHQDLLAASAEARLVKLARGNQSKIYQKSPKFIDDVMQIIGQTIVGIYYQLYQKSKRLNIEKTDS